MSERTQRSKRSEAEVEAHALPSPIVASTLLREFAEPLLYVDPAGPADIETMRTAMMLAMICWNLPVYEAMRSPLFEQGQRTLEEVSQRVPKAVALRLRKLLETRKASYETMPFLALVEVHGTTLKNATIAAEARRPKARH